MPKLSSSIFVFIIVLAIANAGTIRHKRQLFGYMGGLGLTPEQTILNRNIAISQAQLRQNLISSQIATNRAVQQARFNANNLMAQARANIAAANANALMIGK